MIYFICPSNHTHINYAPGNPSNDWCCGWPNCGARLRYSPTCLFVYQKAEMMPAIYAPGGAPISEFHMGQYEGFKLNPRMSHLFDPQPTIQTTTSISNLNSTSTSMDDEQFSPPPTSRIPPVFVEMTFYQPVIVESQSQETLYPVLDQKGYLFLCRNGKFGPYKPGNQITDPDETVPEPGVVGRHDAQGYCRHQYHPDIIMGRNESNKRFYGQGQISYPDYIVQKEGITYSIELKTPRGRSFKKYLGEHFYEEMVFSSGRSIVQELEIRRGLTPSQVEICLLFDIRNIDDDDQVLTDLKNNIASRLGRKNWWMTNINGVMFYKRSGLTKRFTISDVLAGQSINNTMQQKNIMSFFTNNKNQTK